MEGHAVPTRRLLYISLLALLALAVAAPPAGAADPPPASAWDRPALTNPITKVIDAQHTSLVLDTTRDYVITLGATANALPKGVSIWGGHNVVIDGGTINVTSASGGLTLKNQTGTMWIQNLHIAGPQLMEGIDLDQRQPNATVVLRGVLIDIVHGSYSTNHADVIQTWAGPSRLLIDGLTASTTYQGFFLLPRQQWSSGPWPKVFDFRHVDIDAQQGGYALWRDGGNPYPQYVQDVYVTPNPAKPSRDSWLWPKPSTGDVSWVDVVGAPALGGSFVVATPTGAAARADLLPPVPLAGEEVL
jgi:hypothetical protein